MSLYGSMLVKMKVMFIEKSPLDDRLDLCILI